MNLFPARLARASDGRFRIALGAASLAAAPPGAAPEALAAHAGSVVTAGVRPEAFRLAAEGEDALPASVVHVEYLGHESLVHVRLDAAEPPAPCVVRLAGAPVGRRGGPLRLAAAPEQVHLFAPDGRAL